MNDPQTPATAPPPWSQLTAQVQYVEPLPDWLHEELAAGRDKLPELRQALIRAQKRCSGLLAKTKTNKDQNYKYTGHDDVVEHVRQAMAEEGLSVDQATYDLEEIITITIRGGETTVWKWRCVCVVWHESGAGVPRIVRVLTVPNNKASFVASTAAERTLLMRLMRLAGTKEGDPEGESDLAGAQQQQRGGARRPHHASRSNGAQPKKEEPSQKELDELSAWVATRLKVLPECQTEKSLILWGRVLTSRRGPKNFKAAAWAAWEEMVVKRGLKPAELFVHVRTQPPIPEERIGTNDKGELIDTGTGEILS